jgi:hypothetical protein
MLANLAADFRCPRDLEANETPINRALVIEVCTADYICDKCLRVSSPPFHHLNMISN